MLIVIFLLFSRSLIQSLKNSKKRLIAGVQSDVSNFGILLLNLFDFVYVSDKANFSTDYYLYNTIPELLYPDWCRDQTVSKSTKFVKSTAVKYSSGTES